jgi:phenylalanyl-tRNA synthetase beta chain
MKLSEQWLREWINPSITREQLIEQLTMAGLEVESVEAVSIDHVIDIKLTPNRGDCLSVLGIAREVGVLNHAEIHSPDIKTISPTHKDVLNVTLKDPAACPHYVGRIIRNINKKAETPEWLKTKLARAGVNSISPVVDVTNYVLLELGQPLHAFDFAKLHKEIIVRKALKGETLKLLDERTVTLDPNTLIIADAKEPLAIAGVMGGFDSAVSADTEAVFLESAFFAPVALAGCARRYALQTDSAYRFERGVDPKLQILAIERATQLLLEIVGGSAGPLIEKTAADHLPKHANILLRRARIQDILGVELPDQKIESILKNLGMQISAHEKGWNVVTPSYRFDISLEIDLIEELARIYGYNHLPKKHLQLEPIYEQHAGHALALTRVRDLLVDRGYQEAITYSFVDPKLQQKLDPSREALPLLNPISPELSVMRTQLWPGLITALLYNQHRQQSRIRLFETGICFTPQGAKFPLEELKLSGVITGNAYPEQWGLPARSVDFFDLKGDVQALLALTQQTEDFTLEVSEHPALHPGQASQILRQGKVIGHFGKLHPSLEQSLGLTSAVYLFEISLTELLHGRVPRYQALAKFPSIRRDLAFLVDESVSAAAIQKVIEKTAGAWLKSLQLFDVYQGKGVPKGQKSLALGLILQDATRTLVDDEVAELMEHVVSSLKKAFNVTLRT